MSLARRSRQRQSQQQTRSSDQPKWGPKLSEYMPDFEERLTTSFDKYITTLAVGENMHKVGFKSGDKIFPVLMSTIRKYTKLHKGGVSDLWRCDRLIYLTQRTPQRYSTATEELVANTLQSMIEVLCSENSVNVEHLLAMMSQSGHAFTIDSGLGYEDVEFLILMLWKDRKSLVPLRLCGLLPGLPAMLFVLCQMTVLSKSSIIHRPWLALEDIIFRCYIGETTNPEREILRQFCIYIESHVLNRYHAISLDYERVDKEDSRTVAEAYCTVFTPPMDLSLAPIIQLDVSMMLFRWVLDLLGWQAKGALAGEDLVPHIIKSAMARLTLEIDREWSGPMLDKRRAFTNRYAGEVFGYTRQIGKAFDMLPSPSPEQLESIALTWRKIFLNLMYHHQSVLTHTHEDVIDEAVQSWDALRPSSIKRPPDVFECTIPRCAIRSTYAVRPEACIVCGECEELLLTGVLDIGRLNQQMPTGAIVGHQKISPGHMLIGTGSMWRWFPKRAIGIWILPDPGVYLPDELIPLTCSLIAMRETNFIAINALFMPSYEIGFTSTLLHRSDAHIGGSDNREEGDQSRMQRWRMLIVVLSNGLIPRGAFARERREPCCHPLWPGRAYHGSCEWNRTCCRLGACRVSVINTCAITLFNLDLYREGLKIVLADANAAKLDEAANALSAEYGEANILAIPTDVSKLDQVQALADRTRSPPTPYHHTFLLFLRPFDVRGIPHTSSCVICALLQVNLLMNNAGIGLSGSSTWSGREIWAKVLDVNLWGVINMLQVFTSSMIHQENPSLIINTGSKQGITSPPGNAAYNVSKAGVKVITENLSHELRTQGTKVTAHLFVPGWTFTGMTGDGKMTEKPPGAWTAKQCVQYMLSRVREGEFYIICPDNETSEDLDRLRIRWAADDLVERRPALSRNTLGKDFTSLTEVFRRISILEPGLPSIPVSPAEHATKAANGILTVSRALCTIICREARSIGGGAKANMRLRRPRLPIRASRYSQQLEAGMISAKSHQGPAEFEEGSDQERSSTS
ncbi:short chain dehydrogenase domain-containing protein [Rhizoctonia solani AG-1 IA]|uniref:Short chain dehydrogenase domain-containing protein n=1 Tax=Thanatephorus cucumeris (strain AG1-IA) TaxID=983506 RepID=L8X5W2_THACA|nr:short chain dehydrogenase domain-containing protein [Rhizoctonia solani AG-1 IA]